VLKARPGASAPEPALLTAVREAAGRRVTKQWVDANDLAADKIADAEARARVILEDAERAARQARERALDEGRNAATAELVGAWARLRAEEAARDEKNLDRVVDLARVLAERVLAESLRLDPGTVLAIARQVLASARQARRISLRAHPEDAEILRREIDSLGLEHTVVEIHADQGRPRGALFLDTDLGILDANLTLQLDRLTRALRDGLRS
jgi:flagellar biosynthesis/type III secretory pathway protein FliH